MGYENKKKGQLKYWFIFGLIIYFTFKLVLKDIMINNLLDIYKLSNKLYLVIGILFSILFISIEGLNLYIILRRLNKEIRLQDTIGYSFIGFYFSGITPSASGGQPMQIYYMVKDKLGIESTLALSINFVIYQIISFSFGLLSILVNMNLFVELSNSQKCIFLFSSLANGLIVFLIMLVVFNPRAIKLILTLVEFTTKNFMKKDRKDKLLGSVEKTLGDYSIAGKKVVGDRSLIGKLFITTLLQIFFLNITVYWGIKSMGYRVNLVRALTLQGFVNLGISSMPTPGGAGFFEYIFPLVYKTIPLSTVGYLSVLVRAISFYIPLLVSFIVFIFKSKSYFNLKEKK